MNYIIHFSLRQFLCYYFVHYEIKKEVKRNDYVNDDAY